MSKFEREPFSIKTEGWFYKDGWDDLRQINEAIDYLIRQLKRTPDFQRRSVFDTITAYMGRKAEIEARILHYIDEMAQVRVDPRGLEPGKREETLFDICTDRIWHHAQIAAGHWPEPGQIHFSQSKG